MIQLEQISVIMPVYNGSRYITESLDSLLTQTMPANQIVVIDDGSTDDTPSCIASYESQGVICLKQNHRGPWAARNVAIQEASGDILIFQDADDRAHPKRIELQYQAIKNASGPCLVFGNMIPFTMDSKQDPFETCGTPLPVHAVSPSTLACTRSVWEQLGPFQETNDLGSFLEWYARAHDSNIVDCILSEPVLARRAHDSNHTRTTPETLGKSYIKSLREILGRRRR